MKRTAIASLFVLVLLLALGTPGTQALNAKSLSSLSEQPRGDYTDPVFEPVAGHGGDGRGQGDRAHVHRGGPYRLQLA